MTFQDYNSNIPAANNDPSQDQPLMQTNYASIANVLAIDHVAFSNNQGGYHKKVTFNANIGAPGIGSGVSVLYSASVNGAASLAIQNALGSYAITGLNPSIGASGYTCLPGGLILQWGFSNSPNSSVGTPITFPIAFPTNVFNIQVTVVMTGSITTKQNAIIVSPTVTGFSWAVSSTSNVSGGYWMAIGN